MWFFFFKQKTAYEMRISDWRSDVCSSDLSWATNADYPSSALRNEEEGTTGFRVTVGTNGRVTDCSVTSSSGSSTLDEATCRLITRRARFTPAEDSNGNPITDTYSNRIRWQIPED